MSFADSKIRIVLQGVEVSEFVPRFPERGISAPMVENILGQAIDTATVSFGDIATMPQVPSELDDLLLYAPDSDRDGALVGSPTFGVTGVGDLNTALNVSNGDYVNVTDADLMAAINGSEGSLFFAIKIDDVADWTDAAEHDIVAIYVDANNQIVVRKDATDNTIEIEVIAGGTSEKATLSGQSGSDYILVAASWSKSNNRVRIYAAGSKGTDDTYAGVWAGVPVYARCGASVASWDGNLAHVSAWSVELSQTTLEGLTSETVGNLFTKIRHTSPLDQIAYYPLWEDVGAAVVADVSQATKYFGGKVTMISSIVHATIVDNICTCQDYAFDLDKTLINKQWEDTDFQTLLSEIASNAQPPLIDFDFVNGIDASLLTVAVPSKRFSRQAVRSALTEVVAEVKADWYIDADKVLRVFVGSDASASFELSDAPDFADTFPIADFRRNADAAQVVNRVTHVGGSYYSEDSTHQYDGDGDKTVFFVPYQYHAWEAESAIKVYKNTGTDVSPVWTLQTLGTKYIHALDDYDCLYSFNQQFFEFATAPGDLDLAIKIEARYEIPLRSRVSDGASFTELGRWYEAVIIDPAVTSKAESKKLVQAEIAKRATRDMYTGLVQQPGLRAGMVVPITNALYNLSSSQKLVNRVTTTWLGGDVAQYSIEAGDYVPDLYDIFMELARAAQGEADWITAATLDELLQAIEEITLGETASAPTSSTDYTYGPDADVGQWSLAKWK